MEVRKKAHEREKIRKQETKDAVRLIQELETAGTGEEAKDILQRYKDEGRLTDSMRKKARLYLKEQAMGIGPAEREFINLNDRDQAEIILDRLLDVDTGEEAQKLLEGYTDKGILTDNVRSEMRELIKERAKTGEASAGLRL